MNEEEELRARLEAVAAPPSRLEPAGLVRSGRRRAFRRRSARAAGGAALVTGLLLAVPAIVTRAGTGPAPVPGGPTAGPGRSAVPIRSVVPVPAASCRMTELPVPSGAKEIAMAAVDPTGRYVLGNMITGQNFRPVLWTDGKPQKLPLIAKSVQASAVNARGTVVGLVQDGTLDTVFRYQNGEYTELRKPAGRWHPYPYPSINAAGDVLINVEPQGNSGGEGSIVLLWRAGSTKPVEVPLPAGANGHALDDDGTIVGSVYTDGVATAAYAWDQSGKGRKLRTPPGRTAAGYAVAGDWATGGLWPGDGDPKPALWNIRTGAVTELDAPGPGDGVNAQGWVLAAGAVLRDGRAVELPVPGGQVAVANALSDTGMVVGSAQTRDPAGDEIAGPRLWQC